MMWRHLSPSELIEHSVVNVFYEFKFLMVPKHLDLVFFVCFLFIINSTKLNEKKTFAYINKL